MLNRSPQPAGWHRSWSWIDTPVFTSHAIDEVWITISLAPVALVVSSSRQQGGPI
jgi:hypothetical protein